MSSIFRNISKGSLLELVVPILFFLVIYPISDDFTHFVLTITFYYVILSVSWNIVYGYTGLLSFATAAFAGVGGYTSALISNITGIHPVISIIIGSLASMVSGFFIGVITLKMRGPYLALTTIAFSEIFRRIIIVEVDVTRGNLGLPARLLFPAELGQFPPSILGLVIVTLVLLVQLIIFRSKLGFFMRAIREDEDAAEALGVDTVRIKLFSFAI